MIPNDIEVRATVHGVELPDGTYAANLWFRPPGVSRAANTPVVTIAVRDGNATASAPAVIEGLRRGLSVCLRFADFEDALDVFADFAASRTRVRGAVA